MRVNKKKPITLVNRTNYFVPDKDKVKVTFASPHSYKSRQMKIEGYENRLYWQFRHCEDNDGQTFFYTLTYNERNIPKMYGIPCFDYEDLRELLTGGFRKRLLRKYGSTFKYFVGAELGDGKGKRGMHNNPHYHVILFVESAGSSRFPYSRISEKEMTHLIRLYWQGVDQDDFQYISYKDFNKGIVKEGRFGAIVSDFRALSYCAKYVTKDVKLVQAEPEIESKLRLQLRNKYRYSEEVYKGFFFDYVKGQGFRDPLKALRYLVPDALEHYALQNGFELKCIDDLVSFQPFVVAICDKYRRWPHFYKYLDSFIEPLVTNGINEWRNRYSNKCRISHGVGDYALEHIRDEMNPLVPVPDKKGFKYRPINLYFYRKMFCDVIKDKHSGCNLYVLNEKGLKYKLWQLPKRVFKVVARTSDYFRLLENDDSLFDRIYHSDVNTDVTFSYLYFRRKLSELLKFESQNSILEKYAYFKLVYENRFFRLERDVNSDAPHFPELSYFDDYARFLVPSVYSVDRDDMRLSIFLENPDKDCLPYSQHPAFLRYIGVFRVLDLCADYFFVQNDDAAQEDAERIQGVKRFHDMLRLKEYYSHFQL